jgi:aspartyl-tRNA(Asn)/glutamyl-tRNA(Gln) amidotransferase subunit C
MQKIQLQEVEHIARLSRLALSPQQLQLFQGQLSKILQYMDKLNELDTSAVEPTSHVLQLKNVFREDVLRPSLPAEQMLSNCPDRKDNFYRVPRIIE